MEITQNMIAFIEFGVVFVTLATIIVGSHWNDWFSKKDHHDRN